jgi:hypothetical protein
MSLANRDVVIEAFARHRVVLSEDDPIVALGTVIEIAIDRGSEIQATRIEDANKEMVGLLGQVKEKLSSVMEVMQSAASFVTKSSEAVETEKVTLRREVVDDLRAVSKQFVKEAKTGVGKVMSEEFDAASYRIDEHVKRALAASGGDHRWKDRMVGLLVGWSMALTGWIGYMYFVKH